VGSPFQLTAKTRAPPAIPPAKPDDPPAAAACWFVDAYLNWFAFDAGLWSVRAAALVAVLEAYILKCGL
jgi:hypothetical protein